MLTIGTNIMSFDPSNIQDVADVLYRKSYFGHIDDGKSAKHAIKSTDDIILNNIKRHFTKTDDRKINKHIKIAKKRLLQRESTLDTTWDESPSFTQGVLTPELNNRFRTEIEKTMQDHVEHGFIMCSDNNSVSALSSCTGDSCSIMLSDNEPCEPPHKHVLGDFHTHPTSHQLALSEHDKVLLKVRQPPDRKFTKCVGSDHHPNKIVCFTPKKRVYKQYKSINEWFDDNVDETIIHLE